MRKSSDHRVAVAVCDDHRMFAESLAHALEERGRLVPSVTFSPDEAILALARHDVDVCLLDLSFPGSSGLEVLPRLLEASPRTKILLLTGVRDDAVLAAAIESGAAGVVHKGQDVHAIDRAVERVLDGHVVVDYPTRHSPTTAARHVQRLASFLTPREREVLALLVDGEATESIAESMHVAVSTARTHIQSVLTKLGVHSRLEAVTLAIRHRLVDRPATAPAADEHREAT